MVVASERSFGQYLTLHRVLFAAFFLSSYTTKYRSIDIDLQSRVRF
jgi:hypothetical protein